MSRNGWICGTAAVLGLWATGAASAQVKPAGAVSEQAIPAVFLSDIHFEPFFDPGKAAQLAAAPVSEWTGILGGTPSADRAQRFAALEERCPTRGDDTSFALLESSLRAMRRDAAGARFVTVSGDLIAHAFDCKFGAVFPHAAAGAYRAFVEKTLDFVMEEVDGAFPGVPVYWALGNNDSDCGDYRLDAHGEFLAAVGEEVTKTFPADERKSAEETFTAGGYYSVRLPEPVRNARLLVLDDLFMSSNYATCGGKADASGAEAQLAWLAQQMDEARRSKEKVWVMAHIPPGVDGHASAARVDQVCGAKGPKMFLGSEKIAEVLAAASDVVELVIFGHTHMDELRILKAENGARSAVADLGAATGEGVAVKLVSSISPINGNAPSFTVARVDAATAGLKDFRVFAASNATGVDTAWHEEYDWGKTYHEAEFSAAAVSKVIAGFEADPGAKTEASRAYIDNFYVGSSPLLGLIWPEYVCALRNDSAQGFKACVCKAGK
ncbi:MAG: metallophosphoesterase [Terracidiphilus sp.]